MPNVLIIGDTHIPFEKEGYLEFCKELEAEYMCDEVISIGDIVDNHAISFHRSDPKGYSAGEEYKLAKKKLKKWAKEFPNLKICLGNHDKLHARKLFDAGLPVDIMKNYNDLWETPETWEWKDRFRIDNVLYFHGCGSGGLYPMANTARKMMGNIVIGHAHTKAGVYWICNEEKRLFGMSVGCGLDVSKYAFEYGKDYIDKPFLSAGLVLYGGELPLVVPMEI